MIIKKNLLFIFVFIFSVCLVFSEDLAFSSSETLSSQNQTSTDDFNEENELKQPFSFESAGEALKYEIIIRRFDEKSNSYKDYYFHTTNEEETENCFFYIEPLLPPGKYQSEIIVYNVLGSFEEELTTFDEFLVRRAYRPDVRSVTYPLCMRPTIYLDDFDNK